MGHGVAEIESPGVYQVEAVSGYGAGDGFLLVKGDFGLVLEVGVAGMCECDLEYLFGNILAAYLSLYILSFPFPSSVEQSSSLRRFVDDEILLYFR